MSWVTPELPRRYDGVPTRDMAAVTHSSTPLCVEVREGPRHRFFYSRGPLPTPVGRRGPAELVTCGACRSSPHWSPTRAGPSRVGGDRPGPAGRAPGRPARRARRRGARVLGDQRAVARTRTAGPITVNSSDQALFEWLLAFGAHALTHGENPLFTHLINVPDGVNLAVNTSITVYAVVFAPLTYLIGAAGHLPGDPHPQPGRHRAAPGTGCSPGTWSAARWPPRSAALFIGFSPGMVSHANAHLNWTAGWLVPLLIWRVLRAAPSRAAGCATA